MDKIVEFFEDAATGKMSMMRLVLLLVIIFVMGTWTYSTIVKKDIQPIPENGVTLICALAGVKMVQRFGEKSTEVNTNTTTTTTSTSIPATPEAAAILKI